MCACLHHETGEPIIIKRGELGYWPMPASFTIEKLNADFDATPARIAAMQAGAMFGWHVPAADPDRYDTDGKLVASRIRKRKRPQSLSRISEPSCFRITW